jgi:hypothetical protein
MAGLNILHLFRGPAGNGARSAAGRFGIASGVKASVHKDGIVFLHSSRGVVFSANRVGASIWEGLCDGRSIDEIAFAVSREFDWPPDAVRPDTEKFIADLRSEGILDGAPR